MKLRELIELDMELKQEVTSYAEVNKVSLEKLLDMTLSEWLKFLADELNKIACVIENV